MKERESRAKNLVIVGIPEERNEVIQDITTQFLKEKLDLNCETSITDDWERNSQTGLDRDLS